jgi:hypothetical protein
MPDVSKDVVELLVYVLLPDSVDCLANHVLGFSRFSLHTKARWVAKVTVRGWKCEKHEENRFSEAPGSGTQSPSKSHHGNEDRIYLPEDLKEGLKKLDKRKYKDYMDQPKMVVSTISSIITSTNVFGDFSKTAIISKIIPRSKLRSAGEKAQELWQRFVHQPQTARCLVFLLLLGLLCQEIAKQYEEAANYFVDILKFDVSPCAATFETTSSRTEQ